MSRNEICHRAQNALPHDAVWKRCQYRSLVPFVLVLWRLSSTILRFCEDNKKNNATVIFVGPNLLGECPHQNIVEGKRILPSFSNYFSISSLQPQWTLHSHHYKTSLFGTACFATGGVAAIWETPSGGTRRSILVPYASYSVSLRHCSIIIGMHDSSPSFRLGTSKEAETRRSKINGHVSMPMKCCLAITTNSNFRIVKRRPRSRFPWMHCYCEIVPCKM